MKHLLRFDIFFILVGVCFLVLGVVIEKKLGVYAGSALAFFILAAWIHHKRIENIH